MSCGQLVPDQLIDRSVPDGNAGMIAVSVCCMAAK